MVTVETDSISQEAFIDERKVLGRLNASWKISSLAVNGQSFLVIDGYLLNPKKTKNDLTVNSQDVRDITPSFWILLSSAASCLLTAAEKNPEKSS